MSIFGLHADRQLASLTDRTADHINKALISMPSLPIGEKLQQDHCFTVFVFEIHVYPQSHQATSTIEPSKDVMKFLLNGELVKPPHQSRKPIKISFIYEILTLLKGDRPD